MATSEKGTKENPYTMSEYETLAGEGKWEGGYVKDDSNTVVYMLKEVECCGSKGYSGYSGSGSGSWGSVWWGSDWWGSDPYNPWGNEDNTGNDDTGGGGTHTGGDNPGGNNTNPGGGGGGGGQQNSNNNTNSNTNKLGVFNLSTSFYTKTAFETMRANKSWKGGNVFSIGYVNSDGYIHPAISQLGTISEKWINEIGNAASGVLENIKKGCQAILTSPYIQATSRYYSGSGKPLHLDVNTLGLNNMPNELLRQDPKIPNQYTINLVSTDLIPILSGHSLEESSRIISTALTLGNITLTKTGTNQYVVKDDTYDFEMHDWNTEAKRNVLTIIGGVVSEGICIGIDSFVGKAIGGYTGRAFMISAGILNRHIIGDTSFKICIDGTLKTK